LNALSILDKPERSLILQRLDMRKLLPNLLFRNVLCVAVVLGVVVNGIAAEPPKSLLPIFGTKGREMLGRGQPGHDIRGWLPDNWIDNSSWAPVSAVYAQLNDAPAENMGAVRVEVTKRHSHHLQMTTYPMVRPYKQGTTYVLSGWIRGPQDADVFAGFREDDEPRGYYAGQNLFPTDEWKTFSVEWTPEMDVKACVMISFLKVGSVDLAGITLAEKK
jgi:hypothetical protein